MNRDTRPYFHRDLPSGSGTGRLQRPDSERSRRAARSMRRSSRSGQRGPRRRCLKSSAFVRSRHCSIDKQTAQAEIQKAFATLKQQLKPQDTFFLFLIGHGSGDDGQYKFNISGPDYTADDYNKLLATLNVGRIVIVAATPSAAPALEKFAGKNRVVVTATRSGQEGNDIVFYEYFLEALQSPAADEDKDQKISVWEAFKYAVSGTERYL